MKDEVLFIVQTLIVKFIKGVSSTVLYGLVRLLGFRVFVIHFLFIKRKALSVYVTKLRFALKCLVFYNIAEIVHNGIVIHTL